MKLQMQSAKDIFACREVHTVLSALKNMKSDSQRESLAGYSKRLISWEKTSTGKTLS